MREGIHRLRWLRAAMLMLLGLVAAWSWLFLISKWGPAKRIDILTFKAGVTSRVMRTLLRFPESTMHEHDAAGMSAIYNFHVSSIACTWVFELAVYTFASETRP